MLALQVVTWVRFLVWLDLGMIIYWFYGRTHSPLVNKAEAERRTSFQTLSNFVYITGIVVAIVAGFTPINVLGEMTSIGTLFAFVIVCAAVMILRSRRPDARRPFRVPFGPVIPILGVVSCVYLMVNLTVMTWVRFLVWLDFGMIIYWFYGRTHSPLVDPVESRARSGAENLANFLKIAGYMLLFNGFCITLLALLTEWGVTTEELAKWHELDALLSRVGMHINPEIADAFGIKILLAGAVVLAAGLVLARSVRKQ